MNHQTQTLIVNALRKAGYTGNKRNMEIIAEDYENFSTNSIEETIQFHTDELDKVLPLGLAPAAFTPSHVIELNDWYSFKYF